MLPDLGAESSVFSFLVRRLGGGGKPKAEPSPVASAIFSFFGTDRFLFLVPVSEGGVVGVGDDGTVGVVGMGVVIGTAVPRGNCVKEGKFADCGKAGGGANGTTGKEGADEKKEGEELVGNGLEESEVFPSINEEMKNKLHRENEHRKEIFTFVIIIASGSLYMYSSIGSSGIDGDIMVGIFVVIAV